MRRTLVGLCAAFVALLLSAISAAAPTTASVRPALRAVPGTSLTVRGTGFVPKEVVTLTLYSANVVRATKTVASVRGTFTAHFVYPPSRCPFWRIKAIGKRSGTVWLRGPMIECASLDLMPRAI